MKNLQLSLKKNWFEMTKSGEKTEDYREITPYWANRLIKGQTTSFWKGYLGGKEIVSGKTVRIYGFKDQDSIDYIVGKCKGFKEFRSNIMTLGYPKRDAAERILKLEHKGIEIRTGNPEWGAEPNVLYFVIKHGAINRSVSTD
jgi:hypothetical protein